MDLSKIEPPETTPKYSHEVVRRKVCQRDGGQRHAFVRSCPRWKYDTSICLWRKCRRLYICLPTKSCKICSTRGRRENGANPSLKGGVATVTQGRSLQRDSVLEGMVGAMIFLASNDSALVTGQTLVADGGSVMHRGHVELRNMPHVTYLSDDGERTRIELQNGTNLMFGAMSNGVLGIVGECGGVGWAGPRGTGTAGLIQRVGRDVSEN
jgi:hypothetical protein